jgi:hypothetical protein
LNPQQQQLTDNLRNLNFHTAADQYAHVVITNQKIQGNHSDQPEYGHRNLYRTASDTVQHDKYHDTEGTNLGPTTTALKDARTQALISDKTQDPLKHFAAAQAALKAQKMQVKYVRPTIPCSYIY